ncbi:nucleotidyltransferase [Rudanella lutea]|uniref:nucleotidyltransferase n=1 Tax=Rudanella lutea TaxID=451374 RepID=UPI0003677DF5|nr:nucleotidyltransferase [Rudanella lutea]
MTRDQEEFLQVLNRHQVEYVVIGGKAVQSYGSTRKADDIDVWINPSAENANKMVSSVKEFLGANMHPRDFTDDKIVYFGRNPYRIDIHKDVPGLGQFADHYPNRVPARTKDGTDYSVVSPHDLVASKKAAGRPKDLQDITYIEERVMGITRQPERTRSTDKPAYEAQRGTARKVDFDEFKQRINLVEYAMDQGYIKDRQRSGGNSVTLYKDDARGRDKIVVYPNQRSGIDIYFNPNDGADKGTVVQFQHRRGTGEWKDTIESLQRYIGQVPEQQRPARPAPPPDNQQIPTREQAVVRSFDLKPLTDDTYLRGRGLSPATVNAPEFENTVFNRSYFDRSRGKQYTNTVFPIKNEQGTIAIIVRNDGLKMVEGPRGDGVWISNPKVIGSDGRLDRLVIAENPIDAMSFHQLKPPVEGEKRLYIGTAGNLSSGAPDTVQKLIDRYQPKQIVMANDNDNGGFRTNINLVGRLRYPGIEESNNIQAQLAMPTPSQLRLTVSVSYPDQATGKQQVQQLTERFSAALNKNDPRVDSPEDEPTARINVRGWQGSRTEFEISMPNTRQNLVRTQNELVAAKGLNEVVALKLPVHKDFTEDLQRNEKLTLPALPGEAKQQMVQSAEGPKMMPKFDLPSFANESTGMKR